MRTKSILVSSIALFAIFLVDGASFQAEAKKKCRGMGCVGKAIEKAAHDTGNTLQKAGQDTGHTLEKAGQDTGRTLEKAGQDVGREAPKIVDQARTDTRNALDRIDPRLAQFGRDFDKRRLEFQAVLNAPALEQWLRRSRETSIKGALPVPQFVRDGLRGWCGNALMDWARYRIGDGGELNLANNSFRFGSAQAVTLIDVIVFKNANEAASIAKWAHELKHVQQFKEWGARKFAVRYLRSWNGVEDPGYALENGYSFARPSVVVPQWECVL